MILRIMPSDPQFEEVNFYAEWIARLKNPQVWFDLQDIPDAERLACISIFESLFEELTH